MKKCKCVFSIFGATGDLANRKLLPAFYFMERERQLKEGFTIVCIARKEKSQKQCKKEAEEAIMTTDAFPKIVGVREEIRLVE